VKVRESFGWPAGASTDGVVGGLTTSNGGAGVLKLFNVMAVDERLVTVTGIETGAPLMGCGSNATASGDQLSEGLVLSPSPLNVTADVSPVILAVSIPSLAPNALGVKVTGTVML
jgi:hypothetical protein